MQRLATLPKLASTLVVLAVGASLQAGDAVPLSGKIVRVMDGDTVVIETGGNRYRIHLAAIDAPECDQPRGEASMRSLHRILAGQEARVYHQEGDRWGRLTGYVRVAPLDCPTCGYTLDAGLYQLTVGMAWHATHHAHEQPPEQRGQYEFAEFEARAKKVGLWSAPAPVAPWAWRNRR